VQQRRHPGVLSAIDVGAGGTSNNGHQNANAYTWHGFRLAGMCRRFGALVVLAYINHMWYLECVSDIFAHLCDSRGGFATGRACCESLGSTKAIPSHWLCEARKARYYKVVGLSFDVDFHKATDLMTHALGRLHQDLEIRALRGASWAGPVRGKPELLGITRRMALQDKQGSFGSTFPRGLDGH
jgi:hypothetical protein